MTSFSITDLARIIERDNKDATYKYSIEGHVSFPEPEPNIIPD